MPPRFRVLAIAALLMLTLLQATPALAGPNETRVRVELNAPFRSQFLERPYGEATWTVLCESSCFVDALPDDVAEHVVTNGKVRVTVQVGSVGASPRRLTVEIPKRTQQLVGAVALGIGGYSSLLGLMVWSIGPIHPLTGFGCSGDPDYEECQQRHADEDDRIHQGQRRAAISVGS